MRRLIIGMSGASGAVYGIRLLEVLRGVKDVETHLIVSAAARRTIALETDYSIDQVMSLANEVHKFTDVASCVSSGSFRTDGMAIVPCSAKTLSGVANSYGDNLLIRAADVVLKDRGRLVLVLRETPLHLGHARLMVRAIEMGAIVMPAMPGFYHRPQTVGELVDQLVNRILDQLGVALEEDLFPRWQGVRVVRPDDTRAG